MLPKLNKVLLIAGIVLLLHTCFAVGELSLYGKELKSHIKVMYYPERSNILGIYYKNTKIIIFGQDKDKFILAHELAHYCQTLHNDTTYQTLHHTANFDKCFIKVWQ